MNGEQKPSSTQYNNAKPWQLLAFACNNSASNIQFFMFLMFFIYYCTDSLGLSAVVVGALMTASRIFDAITDPIIGLLIDKTNTKLGKFRPFMIAGTVIMDIAIVSLFWGVSFSAVSSRYIWIGLWYVIWVIGYTCVTACTKGAQTILTNNPKQRPVVSGIDQIIMIGIDLLVFSFGMIILNAFGGIENPAAMRLFAMMVAGISTFFSICAIAGIWNKDNETYYGTTTEKKKTEKVGIADYWRIIKNNDALQMLIVAASTNKIAKTIQSSSTVYFFLIVIGDANLQATINAPATIISLLGSFIAIAIAVKSGQKKSFVVGTWLSFLSILILLVLRPFSAGLLPVCIGLISFMLLSEKVADTNLIPMIADCSDYEVWKNHQYAPGVISTIFSFVDKMVSSVSGLLLGSVLGFAGYSAGAAVTPTLYWSVLLLYLGSPLIGHIFSLLAMKKYPITKELYQKMTAEINERKQSSCP